MPPRPEKRAARAKGREARADTTVAAIAPLSPLVYRLQILAALIGLVFLACHRLPTVASEPGGRFEDPDAMFHIHRVIRTVEAGAVLPPVFDPWENFPEGGRAVWPPLHDASLALFARLGGSAAADPRRGLVAAGAFPVLELGLVLIAGASLARRLAGERAGALAAWLMTLTPSLVRRGAYGEVDHNISEVLGAVLFLYAATEISRRREPRPRADALLALAWGGAVLLGLGFYAGLILSSAVVAGGFILLDLFDRDSAGLASARLSLGYGVAAAVLPLFASLRVHPDPADPWRLGPVYVLLLSAGAAGSGLMSAVAGLRWKSLSRERHGLALVGAVLGVVVAALQPGPAWGGFVRGLGFLGARDPWLSTISEFQPLVFSTFSLFSTAPALPVALAAVGLFAFWKAPGRGRSQLLPLVPAGAAFLVMTLLAVAQKRFVPPAVALAAVACGIAWKDLFADPVRRWTVRGVFAVSLLAAAPYLIFYLPGSMGRVVRTETYSEGAAQVVAGLTAAPGKTPEWGVLAPWDYGHPILALSGRAVALNNFGSFHPGFDRKMRLFLETSPARAAAELTALRLRYVIVNPPPELIPLCAVALGEEYGRYYPGRYVPGDLPKGVPTPLVARTLVNRLHDRDAAPDEGDTEADRSALARFRKLWESPKVVANAEGKPVPYMKLFELLPAR